MFAGKIRACVSSYHGKKGSTAAADNIQRVAFIRIYAAELLLVIRVCSSQGSFLCWEPVISPHHKR